MKPPRFEYYDPRRLEEALQILDAHQGDSKILSGGQSLMPLLNMRLVRPKIIVDINRIEELSYVRAAGSGVAIGANARQRALERDRLIAERLPILQQSASYIAHPQIRSRGSICGSIAHADPAAELPALAVALDAELVANGPKGSRTLASDSFFMSYFTTTLEPNEILTEARFPAPPKEMAWSLLEVSRRHGDFALVGVVAGLAVDPQRQTVTQARLVYFGVGPIPLRVRRPKTRLSTNVQERSPLMPPPNSPARAWIRATIFTPAPNTGGTLQELSRVAPWAKRGKKAEVTNGNESNHCIAGKRDRPRGYGRSPQDAGRFSPRRSRIDRD
jgi:CO/xanthine dehydrogenase FAD-binding subunit